MLKARRRRPSCACGPSSWRILTSSPDSTGGQEPGRPKSKGEISSEHQMRVSRSLRMAGPIQRSCSRHHKHELCGATAAARPHLHKGQGVVTRRRSQCTAGLRLSRECGRKAAQKDIAHGQSYGRGVSQPIGFALPPIPPPPPQRSLSSIPGG